MLKLTRNMRLQVGNSNSEVDEIREFSDWILLSVGDGKVGGPNDGEGVIEVNDDIHIDGGTTILAIAESTYPCLQDHL